MEYELIRSTRLRSVRIVVDVDGTVRVHAPVFAPEFAIKTFLWRKRSWIEDARARVLRRLAGKKPIMLPRGAYKLYKEEARHFIVRKLEYWNRFFGFRYGNVSIRNQKARWGSCSARGNLSFNYKLLFVPQHLADYVIVHELAHLAHLNHSAAFWKVVEQAIPGYKKHRAELRSIVFSTGKKGSSAVNAQL